MSLRDDANAVLSLEYKYANLMDCIEGQRPSLLSDDVISFNQQMIEYANKAIKERVLALAGEYNE